MIACFGTGVKGFEGTGNRTSGSRDKDDLAIDDRGDQSDDLVGKLSEGSQLMGVIAASDDDDLLDGRNDLLRLGIAADGLLEMVAVEVLTVLDTGLTLDDGDHRTFSVELDSVDAGASRGHLELEAEVGADARDEGSIATVLDSDDRSHEVALAVTSEVGALEGDSFDLGGHGLESLLDPSQSLLSELREFVQIVKVVESVLGCAREGLLDQVEVLVTVTQAHTPARATSELDFELDGVDDGPRPVVTTLVGGEGRFKAEVGEKTGDEGTLVV